MVVVKTYVKQVYMHDVGSLARTTTLSSNKISSEPIHQVIDLVMVPVERLKSGRSHVGYHCQCVGLSSRRPA